MSAPPSRPWYREPWPWILMAGPAVVVVAGAVTVWLAVASADGLVVEDYYRQGLAINRTLARQEAARVRGISARLTPGPDAVQLDLTGAHGDAPAVFVLFSHATRQGYDERVRFVRGPDGAYRGGAPARVAGRWHVIIEPPDAGWRLAGEWSGRREPFTLVAGEGGASRR